MHNSVAMSCSAPAVDCGLRCRRCRPPGMCYRHYSYTRLWVPTASSNWEEINGQSSGEFLARAWHYTGILALRT
jgi:hypothetical protein